MFRVRVVVDNKLIILNVINIYDSKNNIIDQLDNAGADVTASTDGEKGGEGYVATRDKIKLVPRHRWKPN